MDRTLIETYAAGGKQLVDAYQGLNRQQLMAVPVAGTWSLHQIAVHMMESDMIGCDRMKRIAAMDKPLLIGYDESAFARLPGLDQIDTLAACRIFAENRQLMAIVLRALPDDAFERWGVHNEIGRVSLAEMVKKYVEHLNGHLKHVFAKRELVSQ